MNIFAAWPSAKKSAEFLDDKRVVKMVLETCQLLCTSINLSGGVSPYKSTHKNHPCAVWARESKANYQWLLDHFFHLLNEYRARYGRTHKCEQYYDLLWDGIKHIPDAPATDHPNCTIFNECENVHLAYILYMQHKWLNDKRKPTWYKLDSNPKMGPICIGDIHAQN